MAIRNWRWFHWLAISVVVGGLLGVVLTNLDFSDPSIQTVDWPVVRRKIPIRTDAGDSVLTRIRVSPAVRDGNGRLVQSTTFWERQKNRTTGTWDLTRQYQVITPVPLSPTSPRPDYGILDVLGQQKQAIPSLDYRFEWWRVPRTLWLLCVGGSVLAIGVAWPLVLRALVKVGLGAPPDERMDLSAVRTTGTSSPVPTGPAATADDRRKLADLNAALEAGVAGLAMTEAAGPVDAPPTGRPGPASVRPLEGGPLTPAASAAVPDEPGDFQGEFYPVARPVAKKD